MEITDNNGKWLIENGVKILIEPSASWITKCRPIKTSEQLQEEYVDRVKSLIKINYPDTDSEIAIIRKYNAGIDVNNEFEVYNTYVESCKTQAKIEFGL